MLPDALPQLIETLLRLPLLEAAQLRELIQHLPDPRAAAQEMVRRGWITQDQFSSLFPGPQQPTPQETMVPGTGEESPTDADGEDWSLTISDHEDKADAPPEVERGRPDCTDEEMWRDANGENWDLVVSDDEDKADVPPEVERTRPDCTDEEMRPEPETVGAGPVLSGAASTPQFESDVLVPPVAGGNEARRRESDTDRRLSQWIGWASKGLLMCSFFLWTLFAGLQFFEESSTVPPATRQESREANAGDPARVVELPPAVPIVPSNNAEQDADLPNRTARADDAKPKPKDDARPPVTQIASSNNAKQRDELLNTTRQNTQPTAPAPVPVDPKQILTLNVHLPDFQRWPAIEARIKALADSPEPQCKWFRSGDYMWVDLSPVKIDPGAFARKINFGKLIAVYPDQRLIYVDSRR
jgi:hypothetical protein